MSETVPPIAGRLSSVRMSASTAMTEHARALRAEGVRVIRLSSGEPDNPTPSHVIEAAHAAALAGEAKYPPLERTQALKATIHRKFRSENDLDHALNEVLAGNSGNQIIFNALLATCDAGSKVVIPAPAWVSYADMARMHGAVPVPRAARRTMAFGCAPRISPPPSRRARAW